MSQPDHDQGLEAAFAGFRQDVTARITPRGPGQVRTTVRRRRRTAIAVSGVAAALLIAVPAAVYANLDRADEPPPPADRRTTAPPGPTPAATPTPSATGAPAPDGRLSREDLLAATLTLPPWRGDGRRCPTDGVRLDRPGDPYGVDLDVLRHSDVDGDGARETLALLRCHREEDGDDQVVAFDRDAAGAIVVLGQVVATEEGLGWLADVQPGSGSSVRVRVFDLRPDGHWDADWSQRQWRTYAWDGQRFAQTGGPREFGPNPHLNDLTISAGDLTFGAEADDGRRTGTTSVTIRNNGPGTVEAVRIAWSIQTREVWRSGAGWPECGSSGGSFTGGGGVGTSEHWCELGRLKAGERLRLTFGFHAFGEVPSAPATVTVERVPERPGAPVPWDPVPGNNTAEFRLNGA